jgi:hypothetical protein
MTNDQMKAGRFLKIHKGRRMFRFITANLNAGNSILVRTYTKATRYKAKHVDMFRLAKNGDVFVQRGKSWDCINGCGITAEGDVAKLIAA